VPGWIKERNRGLAATKVLGSSGWEETPPWGDLFKGKLNKILSTPYVLRTWVRLNWCMKKTFILAAVLLGAVSASQAGVRLNIGFNLPLLPPLPGVVVSQPVPAVACPAPPVCAPETVVVAPCPAYYGYRAGWHERHERGHRHEWHNRR
jgi:hypothetical protein